MIKNLYLLPFFLLLFGTAEMHAQSNDGWIFKNEKSGVKVYYRKTADVYEVKLITSIQSTLSGLVTLLSEVENYPVWGYKVAEAKVLREYGVHDVAYYSRLDFPWPLDDRDIIMHNKIEQDPDTRKIIATSTAEPTIIPEKEGIVRVKKAHTTWTIIPGQGGWLYVEYYIYSDPGGSIPDWLVNMAIDVGPRETIQGIRKFISQPQYQTAKLAHIKD
ncbi:MAG: hypothetical protein JNJ57_18785 [Saprospiraceae bacterium]|nr:hypothetical protein [Saprospiraceae bacterium]